MRKMHVRGDGRMPTGFPLPRRFHLIRPHRHEFLRIQQDVVPVGPLLRVVHGPLAHVGLHLAGLASVFAAGDLHPVTAASRPSHGPSVRTGHAAGGGSNRVCYGHVCRDGITIPP